ncbi:MAG: esterase-like activity of phytase family protein [Sphingomonadaceae bacterium]|nr:esterase-like activity of phytase family protein [Sphingomonadaceae bacterium]
MRAAFLPLVLFFTASITPPAIVDPRPAPPVADTLIEATPIPLDPANRSAGRIGALRWLGGWELTSANPEFGGISAIAFDAGAFLAVSDAGGVFRFALGEDGAITSARILMLPDGPAPARDGAPRKEDRDAEAIVFAPDTLHLWVAFERANAVWRYSVHFEIEGHAEPAAMRGWPVNGGPEAMVRLPDGRFLILSEEAGSGPGTTAGLIFAADPVESDAPPLRFAYVAPEGYVATDAAALPDGRLLILNRRFNFTEGPSAILAVAPLDDLREGGRLVPRPIATLRAPLTVDNMEALAVGVEDGRTIVWIASDDNFNPLQRTLLMKFELVE